MLKGYLGEIDKWQSPSGSSERKKNICPVLIRKWVISLNCFQYLMFPEISMFNNEFSSGISEIKYKFYFSSFFFVFHQEIPQFAQNHQILLLVQVSYYAHNTDIELDKTNQAFELWYCDNFVVSIDLRFQKVHGD